jgi:glutathione S-transferase
MAPKFTVWSFPGSQWAGVAHLTLAEKGFTSDDYEIKDVDLIAADNFSPEYLEINPGGTVPSLTSPDLDKALIHSTDILRYLDGLRGEKILSPGDSATEERVKAIHDLVHSDEMSTNLILLHARDAEEMNAKKGGIWKDFVVNRQHRLEKEQSAHPSHAFYGPKAVENGAVYQLYTTSDTAAHEDFFKTSHDMYRAFAAGMDRLEDLLVLPFAAGERVTEADFHVVPWMAHAMWGAGTEPSEVQNFGTLEALIQKSVPDFKVGPKTKQWWARIAETDAFRTVFPNLH